MEATELAKSFSIAQYRELKANKDTQKIAELIYQRFYERYILPFENNENRHGFSMMAVCCLMIEALQSFKEGQNESEGKIFERFFHNSTYFKEFQSTTFYSDIRCGILHQAETRGGWKIWRIGKLRDESKKAINADLFMDSLKKELADYKKLLISESFNSQIWKRAFDKLEAICDNSCL